VTVDDGERGSASIWVLGCCGLLVAVGTAGVVRAEAVLARHRAESAADLAALAAATQIGLTQAGSTQAGLTPAGSTPAGLARGAVAATGVAATACGAARMVAAANDAVVTGCTVHVDAGGRSGTVRVQVRTELRLPVVGQRTVTATARAGRLTPGGGGRDPAR
jgi:hypothetical protein